MLIPLDDATHPVFELRIKLALVATETEMATHIPHTTATTHRLRNGANGRLRAWRLLRGGGRLASGRKGENRPPSCFPREAQGSKREWNNPPGCLSWLGGVALLAELGGSRLEYVTRSVCVCGEGGGL